QHAPNSDFVLVQVIIDRERKSFRGHSMITEYASTRARIEIRENTNQRGRLAADKSESIEQVGLGEAEDSKRHASFAALRRIRFLASSQPLNFALPFFMARSASRSAWACHAGDSKRSSLERSAQSASIARNFSSRDIFCS